MASFKRQEYTPKPYDQRNVFEKALWVGLGLLLGLVCLVFVKPSSVGFTFFILIPMGVVAFRLWHSAYELTWNDHWLVIKHQYSKQSYKAFSMETIGKVAFRHSNSKKNMSRWEYKVANAHTKEVSTWNAGLHKLQANNLLSFAEFAEERGIEVVFEADSQPEAISGKGFSLVGALLLGCIGPLAIAAFFMFSKYEENKWYEQLSINPSYSVGYTKGIEYQKLGKYIVYYEFYADGIRYEGSTKELVLHYYGKDQGKAGESFYHEDHPSKSFNPADSIVTEGGLYLVVFSQDDPSVHQLLLTKPLEPQDTLRIQKETVDPEFLKQEEEEFGLF